MKRSRGGNGEVTFSNGRARKTLFERATKNPERLARFKKEVQILREIEGQFENVVNILDADLGAKPPWYEMPKYDGTANDLLHATKGNATHVARLVLPIAETLGAMAERNPPIFHRDIKPDNLLVDGSRLMIADFGCAFLQTDETKRLTSDFRAVGPMMFRAPEYQAGRVDDVNQAGDVFSLGKVIWYLLNGVEDEVFPYTLWFPHEYDIEVRFPNDPQITKLNLLIARMVDHDPTKRPSFMQVALFLNNFLGKTTLSQEEADAVKMRKIDEMTRLDRTQALAQTSTLIRIFVNDVKSSLELLQARYPSVDLIPRLLYGISVSIPIEQRAAHVVHRGSDCPLWNFDSPNYKVSSRINPTGTQYLPGLSTQMPYLSMRTFPTAPSNAHQEFAIYLAYTDKDVLGYSLNDKEGTSGEYSISSLTELLDRSIRFRYGLD